MQLFIILDSPLINNFKEKIGIDNKYVDQTFDTLKNVTLYFSKPLFGVTAHEVFIDQNHYDGYAHIIAIVHLDKNGNETWLPLIDKNGQPSYYNYGTNWRKMSFSTNNTDIDPSKLDSGIRDFTAFWANKNNIDLDNSTFLIKVKKIESTKHWQKDFLNKLIDKPWIDGGYVQWNNKKFISFIKNIESL